MTFIFRLLTPDLVEVQPQVLTNATASEVNFQNIEFRGSYPPVPAQMPAATATYTSVSGPLLQNIITAFSISTTPESDGIWSGPDYTLVEVPEPQIYTLTRKNTTSTTAPDEVNTQRAIQEATKIIDGLYSFGPKPEVLINRVEILNDEEGEIDSESEDPFIRVPFAYTIEQIPVFVNQDTFYPAEIILDSSYVLSKATFSPYTLDISTNRNHRTIKPDEAVARINQDEAAVVFYSYFGPSSPELFTIESGVLTEARLEYRLDQTTNTLLPYYNFGGTLKNASGYSIDSNIITPALQTDFSSAN